MNDAIIEATAPEGAVTRHHIEAVLRGHGSASIRFAGWHLTEADLNGLDFHGCEFVRCRAGHANLSSCNFTEARFLFCDFNNTKWRGTIVSSAASNVCNRFRLRQPFHEQSRELLSAVVLNILIAFMFHRRRSTKRIVAPECQPLKTHRLR